MTVIAFHNLGFSAARDMYAGVNFSLNRGERLGVVGNNGIGKSTLFRCIAGETGPGEGEVVLARNQQIIMVSQEVPDDLLKLTMFEALLDGLPPAERDYDSWKIDVLLDEIAAPMDHRDRKVGDLSGGWQRMVMLGRCSLSQAEIILLDEPTNHLDLAKILWLENWINSLPPTRTVAMISHDRLFLDNCTTCTLFLRVGESKNFNFPFSKAADFLAQHDEEAQILADKTNVKLKKMEQSAHKLRQIGVDHFSEKSLRKSIQIQKKAEMLKDTLPELEREERRDITLSNRDTHQKYMIEINNIQVSDPNDTPLFGIEKLVMAKGERLVLFGKNGAGKSQFIELLNRQLKLQREDRVKGLHIAATARTCYLDQHLSFLPQGFTVFEQVKDVCDILDDRCRSLLINAGFTLPMQKVKIASLSPGERLRLALVCFRLRTPNLYFFDEPTNHLDIAGQILLEEQINSINATCIIISHDRRFVENVGNRFAMINGKKLEDIKAPETFYQILRANAV